MHFLVIQVFEIYTRHIIKDTDVDEMASQGSRPLAATILI